MGAPRGNTNRLTTGQYRFLALGKAPKGAAYIHRLLTQLRQVLEAEIIARHGTVGVYHSALIQSTCRHEGRALLLSRYLRRGGTQGNGERIEADAPATPELSLADRLALLRDIAGATDSRDRCLKLLGLDVTATNGDPWGALDAQSKPAEPRPQEAAAAATSEPLGTQDGQGGDNAAS